MIYSIIFHIDFNNVECLTYFMVYLFMFSSSCEWWVALARHVRVCWWVVIFVMGFDGFFGPLCTWDLDACFWCSYLSIFNQDVVDLMLDFLWLGSLLLSALSIFCADWSTASFATQFFLHFLADFSNRTKNLSATHSSVF